MKTNNTLYFCTLFDKNFITRGLAMYKSLAKSCEQFHLYIFCFDDTTNEVLRKLNLSNVTLITLTEFEDKELLEVKKTRSQKEYCWTCTPSTILYCLAQGISHVIYLDADLYFWESPQLIIDEIPEDKSVLITNHNYTPEHDQTATSGKFCVQFVYFKNNNDGLEVANWWRNACNEWCYARFEDGKFGDQKYLDSWPNKFKQVYILQNEGAGVAPWNVQQYTILKEEKKLFIYNNTSQKKFPLIFYHFHYLRNGKNNNYFISPKRYILSNTVVKFIYKEYLKQLQIEFNKLKMFNLKFNPHGAYTDYHVYYVWDYIRVVGSEFLRAIYKLNLKQFILNVNYRVHAFYILKSI